MSHHTVALLPPPLAYPGQVAHAEGAGAMAAIVYDDVYEPLILMAKVWQGVQLLLHSPA